MQLQVSNGFFDWTRPLEAQIAAACGDWDTGVRIAWLVRPVDIQLFISKTIGPAIRKRYEFGSKNVAIKSIRTFPFGDGDYAMVERWTHGRAGFIVAGGT